jgi:hypothetical protein
MTEETRALMLMSGRPDEYLHYTGLKAMIALAADLQRRLLLLYHGKTRPFVILSIATSVTREIDCVSK